MSEVRPQKIFWSSTASVLLGNLSDTGRGRKQVISASTDAVIVLVSLWLAYTLRHGQPFSDFRTTWHVFAVMAPLTVVLFGALGLYRWVVRSSSPRLFSQLAKGAALSALAFVLLTYLFPPDRTNSRSLFVIYGVFLLLGTSSVRLLWQALFAGDKRGEPLAIYGSGEKGRRLVRLLSSSGDFRAVALIDDDPARIGSVVEGLDVLDGRSEHLGTELRRRDASQVVLAFGGALSGADFDATLARLERLGLPVKTVPGVVELFSGARADSIRDISIADILGRSEVLPDPELIGRRVTRRRVLVTGGGGSIGSELARQILKLQPEHLVLLDSCEAALYAITEEFRAQERARGESFPFVALLGSVRDRRGLTRLLECHSIDTVFHAAAYKHVPIVEAQPEEGIETNVFGTRKLLDAAIAAGVQDLVLISTDKAVRPTNAMGASKRAAELILQGMARQQGTTRLSMVRFGNVLDSSGSVVPKFKRQILEGGPITVTHPDITRYFMTIPEAAQLVLQAGALAEGGDVFVLDMGEPMRIVDLARSMVRLYGKALHEETGVEGDIRIVYEGLRPGEKMYEELFLDGTHRSTGVPKIFTAAEAWLAWPELERRLDSLRLAIDAHDPELQRKELLALACTAGVPEPADPPLSTVREGQAVNATTERAADHSLSDAERQVARARSTDERERREQPVAS